MKKIASIAIAVAALSSNAFAQDTVENINPWKHCGIGAAIFDDNGAAAAISNIIWDLGTTAITSKVSSEDSCSGKRTKVALFIQDNFDAVLEQTAMGEGEHVNAMLEILEVADANKASIIASVRSAVNANTQPEAYYNAVIAAI
ncbi:hypothetical protein D210916BOD24_29830 [Alteromonas sp. D210916BOD_24]|uniref:DUF3015 family protein n=1 Tax=Alteromonas sp. D210916BOD_24 TaxID=3157618 RepID=UPI00399CF6AF